MRVSHTQLEIARSDPRSYKSKTNSSEGFFKTGQYRYWQFATRNYHDKGKDNAFQYLEEKFKEKFVLNARNKKRLEEFQYKLENYITDFEELNNSVVGRGTKISMDLGYSNSLSGEIAREDMKLNGSFEIFLFLKEESSWEDELRFPLIQAHYAQIFGVSNSEVAVGVYSFESDQHVSNVYSDTDVQAAVNEARKISQIFSTT
ncbi:MAG: hypothetical protein AAF388_07060 [Bacteroidota bacterium]